MLRRKRACRRCQIRKIGCDGQVPQCGRCAKSQQKCVFPNENVQREEVSILKTPFVDLNLFESIRWEKYPILVSDRQLVDLLVDHCLKRKTYGLYSMESVDRRQLKGGDILLDAMIINGLMASVAPFTWTTSHHYAQSHLDRLLSGLLSKTQYQVSDCVAMCLVSEAVFEFKKSSLQLYLRLLRSMVHLTHGQKGWDALCWLFIYVDGFLSQIHFKAPHFTDLDPLLWTSERSWLRSSLSDKNNCYTLAPNNFDTKQLFLGLFLISSKICYMRGTNPLGGPQYDYHEMCILYALLDWHGDFQTREPPDESLESKIWLAVTELMYWATFCYLHLPKLFRDLKNMKLVNPTKHMHQALESYEMSIYLLKSLVIDYRIRFKRLPTLCLFGLVNVGFCALGIISHHKDLTVVTKAKQDLHFLFSFLNTLPNRLLMHQMLLKMFMRRARDYGLESELKTGFQFPQPLHYVFLE